MKETEVASARGEVLGVTDDELFEMANLSPPRTGLSRRIWVSVNARLQHHRPRLKVEGTDHNFYPVSIDDPVEYLSGWPPGWSAADFAALQRFVALNRQVLLEYWNDRIDTEQAIARVQSI
ncbi:MAG: hypothetical protein C5B50_06925 [Verrucomicrobia bacterium]|nr:MAG: hypothetical protein C5B50_06925 [Verrucomicrobiota bacterium]